MFSLLGSLILSKSERLNFMKKNCTDVDLL